MRRRLTIVVMALAILAIGSAAPAAAQNERFKERFEVPDAGWIWHDPDNNFAVFINVTRDGFCTWADNDFEGLFPALQPVTFQETVNDRNFTVKIRTQAPIELWRTPAEGGVGVCEDTATEPGPWATGTTRLNVTYREHGHGLFYDDYQVAKLTDSDGKLWIYEGGYREKCTWDLDCTFIPTVPGSLRPA